MKCETPCQNWERDPGERSALQLRKRAGELDKSKPIAVYCASGYRASIGASILKQEGFGEVNNVPGSWHAWKEAKFPVEKKSAQDILTNS